MIIVDGYQLQYAKHMLHKDNLEKILTFGLLSHNEAYTAGHIARDISMPEVQARRDAKMFDLNGKLVGLHDMVSFYFNSKNPMLYKRKDVQNELFIVLIEIDIIDTNYTDPVFAIFSDGNAGSGNTKFFRGKKKLNSVDFNIVFAESWNSDDENIKRENRRKRCAEVLVYPSVPPALIKKIVCPNDSLKHFAIDLIQSDKLRPTCNHIEVEINRNYYF